MAATAMRRGQLAYLMLVLFEELFRVHRGHAARPRRGDRLPVAVVLHVSRDEHARNFRQAAVRGQQVAVLVHVQLALEDLVFGSCPMATNSP